ncbi:MAG: efflux RND transporter periplasmic adaptor subunit [Candidatus Eremiobacteraeota bacterium]|nr:efflux RND transporter periplasmic adaptor subunit [Candidatus Eremiobacteraeota bacterium]
MSGRALRYSTKAPRARSLFVALIATASLLLGSCHGKTPAPVASPVPVQVTRAVRQTVPVMVEYVAHTQAVQEITLVPRVEGTLDLVAFRDGSLVHKGQLLMRIQQDQYLAAVSAAQGDLDKAQANLARAQSNVQDQVAAAKLAQAVAQYQYAKVELARMAPLASKSAVSQKDYDQSKTEYDIALANVAAAQANYADVKLNQRTSILDAQGSLAQAQAQLANAKLNLSYTTITSPVTGIISFVQVDQGNYVSPAKTPSLATVSTIDPIKVVFQLSESDYLRIAPRLLVMRHEPRRPVLRLFLSDGSVYPYRGTPENINRAVDQQTGTISIEAVFPNPQALLRPGQFARVEFPIASQQNAVLVPQSSVQSLQGTPVVYVVGPDNKLQLRTLETGTTVGDWIIVQSGVQAGDVVVVGGTNRVQAGITVAPTQGPSPPRI